MIHGLCRERSASTLQTIPTEQISTHVVLHEIFRHVVLHGVCDNQTLSIMGQHCPVIQHLDITGSADVTDVGIQNLVFPLSIQKAGRVNLVNTRAR